MKLATQNTELPPSPKPRQAVLGGAPKKVSFWMLFVVLLLTSGVASVRAQSALDGFDPNANGIIQVVVVQPDGKILIGGDFTIVQGISRNRIARLNPDGMLDQLFDPNSTGYVNTIAVQADGKILVGGSFNGVNSIGGTNRNRIARLDAVTGQADSFDPNASGGFSQAVFSIVPQTDGKIVVGGGFTTIGGQSRAGLARLDATTGLADSFNPSSGGIINAIALQPDGKILVGGLFGSMGGQPRNRIARLDPVTGLADSWNPNATGPAAIPSVNALALQADGKVLAGGIFNTIGGQTRNNIARLDGTTGLADSWNPIANNSVNSITVQPDGKILAGGGFNVFYSPVTIGGQARNGIARLDAVTGLADSFDPNAGSPGTVNSVAVQRDNKILVGGNFPSLSPNGGSSVTRNNIARLETDGRLDRTLYAALLNNFGNVGYVAATAVQPDGKILIGGFFDVVQGVPRNNIARLNPDGTLDTVFNPNANNSVLSIAVQADGKVLVGGYFSGIGGQPRNRIARLNAATGLADTFNPNAAVGFQPNYAVNAIAVQPDGNILVGGNFTVIGSQTRPGIARLDATNGFADSFNANANGPVYAIAVQADGKILAGGSFTNIGGQLRNRIARLDATTGLADSFNPNASDPVYAIAVQMDGKVLVGGAFTNVGGQVRGRIARLNTDGALDPVFNPNANNDVYSIAAQADGKILVGGFFNGANSIGGQLRNRLARLDATTGLADLFDPNASHVVYATALQADGKVLAGGAFVGIGGQGRNFFARLQSGTAAMQNLAVTRTTVTWTRGGSSPQLARATFEYSTNNMNYTPLGNGAAAGANWTLAGLNLPAGQNFYIRARGFYRGGYQNGSESITESVWNVFLAPLSARITSIARLAGGAAELRGVGTPNGTHPLEASPDLTPLSFMSIGNVTPDELGNWLFLDTGASGLPRRFYRLAFP